MLAVQYLENNPDLPPLNPEQAANCLVAAMDRLPMDYLLLGWNVSDPVYEKLGQIAGRTKTQLYHWQPLLCGSPGMDPLPVWRTMNLAGKPIPAIGSQPEFTFLCPNRPPVFEAVLEHLQNAIRHRSYQGVFLDRIRYPSPSTDPAQSLGCFCPDCERAAARDGIDLQSVKSEMENLLKTAEGTRTFIRLCLAPAGGQSDESPRSLLRDFFDFRIRSITRIVRAATDMIHSLGLAVGLDCFSPSLAAMVGQGLSELDTCCDWIKIMTYGHTLAPAGLPFELGQLVGYLMEHGKFREREAMELCSRSAHLPLPQSIKDLEQSGISSEALGNEVRKARASGVRSILAGIELVEAAGVTRLNETQIKADLGAFQTAGCNGLVLSWDLRNIPPRWLDLVSRSMAGRTQSDSLSSTIS